jgi:hypothetical protein
VRDHHDLSDEIARVRHGDSVTASDLAQRLMPWLRARDAETAARAVDESLSDWAPDPYIFRARNRARAAQYRTEGGTHA